MTFLIKSINEKSSYPKDERCEHLQWHGVPSLLSMLHTLNILGLTKKFFEFLNRHHTILLDLIQCMYQFGFDMGVFCMPIRWKE